ncbi:MAG: carbon-nitrogen hydrolase family protein [Bacteriovoracaceae bacterium]|jgi:predicted amidohydrolase|nr:carbon-nitrogen hydrolase family protein [Bacteriovoracaceae bacterium]
MKIGIIQLCSKLDPSENLAKIEKFLKVAVDHGAKAVFLPECFYSLSNGKSPTPYLVEEGNDHFIRIQKLAIDHGISLLGGSAATKTDHGITNKVYNFRGDGTSLASYEKMHLFAIDLKAESEKKVINESDIYTPGKSTSIFEFEGFTIGQGICFDIRFSEMYRYYFQQGCNLLTASAAFTIPTGKAHWHTLLRARAIENQSYVVASAQWGDNNENISTYGHSLVIDPWGRVLLDLEQGEKIEFVDLSLDLVKEVRSTMVVTPDLKFLK